MSCIAQKVRELKLCSSMITCWHVNLAHLMLKVKVTFGGLKSFLFFCVFGVLHTLMGAQVSYGHICGYFLCMN